jgi:hypothetical protein
VTESFGVPQAFGVELFCAHGAVAARHSFPCALGVKRFLAEDAIRRFFHRFTQAHIEAFLRPLWRSMLELLEAPKGAPSPPLI